MQTTTLYIDITQLEQTRANTGIQRTVKEFLRNVLSQDEIKVKIFSYKDIEKHTNLFKNSEVKFFLNDVKNYKFSATISFDIFNTQTTQRKIFFDIDSAWNMPVKRDKLYAKLKEKNFFIFNFIYDLTPLLFPEYAYEETQKNFYPYISALFRYSDYVFFDSVSAKEDFLQLKKKKGVQKEIPVKVIPLGCDFCKDKNLNVSNKYKRFLDMKYILFVGTIEPRKNHEELLDIFTSLAQKYSDLNLIFVGKQGWKVKSFIQKMQAHPLKNKRFFWLQEVDDVMLSHFYKHAFLVTYLSKYEGYGLPIAESLSYSNITIVSKNSSMQEVGSEYADYVNTKEELYDVISMYCENKLDYKKRKDFIRKNFKPVSWQSFYISLHKTFLTYNYPLLDKIRFINR